MGKLNKLSITIGKRNKAELIFDDLFPNFLEVGYKKPSEYITKYWEAYKKHPKGNHPKGNNNLNGKIFEYILATLCVRENIIPVYMSAKVALFQMLFTTRCFTQQKGGRYVGVQKPA